MSTFLTLKCCMFYLSSSNKRDHASYPLPCIIRTWIYLDIQGQLDLSFNEYN